MAASQIQKKPHPAQNQLKDEILADLTPQDDVKIRKTRPTRIRVRGRFIALPNGKTLWKQPGAAKSALTNYGYNFHSHIPGVTREDVWNALDELVQQGTIEFVELGDNEEALQTTRARNNLK